MNHFATPAFWFHYRQLPEAVRDLADKSFQVLKENSAHPSIRLKRVGKFWSARVGLHYRVLARDSDLGLVWFWIGSHDDYEQLIATG
jgi:hypothetical protein